MTERMHQVFATTTDGRRVSVTRHLTYDEAVATRSSIALHRTHMQRWFVRLDANTDAEIKHLEVRAANDPDYAGAPNTMHGILVLSPRGYVDSTGVGRAIGRRRGYRGRGGGWVEDRGGRILCQGWGEVARMRGGVYVSPEDRKAYGITRLDVWNGGVRATGFAA